MFSLKHKWRGDKIPAREYNFLIDSVESIRRPYIPPKHQINPSNISIGRNRGPVGSNMLITKGQPVLKVGKKLYTSAEFYTVAGQKMAMIDVTKRGEDTDVSLTNFAIALDTIMVGQAGRILTAGVGWVFVDTSTTEPGVVGDFVEMFIHPGPAGSILSTYVAMRFAENSTTGSNSGPGRVLATTTFEQEGLPSITMAQIDFPVPFTGVGGSGGTIIEQVGSHAHSTREYGPIPGTIGTP